MSYNLNYTIQVVGAHTYSKCVGEEVLIELKVRKDTLVMPERPVMSLQFKTLILLLIKTLTKLLGEEGIQWTGKEICPNNLLADHRTTDCVGSKSAPGSFLENLRHLLRQIELGKVRSIEEDRILSSDSLREMQEVVSEGPWEPDTRG